MSLEEPLAPSIQELYEHRVIPYQGFKGEGATPMTDDRFKAWLTFWQFILGTVVLGVFSTVISNQIQTREVEIKEQDANARFLEQALQEDVGVRRRLAQYFSHVTRSAELRERWTEYAKIIEVEYQAKLDEKLRLQKEAASKALDAASRERLLNQVAQLEQELSPRFSMSSSISARVYIHIAKEDQRGSAVTVAEVLRASAVVVPGIELQVKSPQNSELRYFRQIDRAEAEGVASTVQTVWPDVSAKYIPGYETSTGIRPRHYELWIGTASNARVSPGP